MAKSILKISKTQETPTNSNDDIVMEFSPTLTAESRIDYIIALSGVKILVSECMTYSWCAISSLYMIGALTLCSTN